MKKEIYLAGGCFWGLSHLLKQIKGVKETICGYANGNAISPSYKEVCSGNTEARECVKVIYDNTIASLENILFNYFCVVNPHEKNKQGPDIGSQYQTGIYYLESDIETKKIVNRIYDLEKAGEKEFYIEKESLKNFYPAEEYHQDYLDKNPNGYCHISFNTINLLKQLIINPNDYVIKAKELLDNYKK